MQVALGIGGRKSSALAMPLVVAMDEETDDAVQRELMLALGRIGSPDAVQALIKFAQPTGRIFGRKPAGLRVAAVEALRLADASGRGHAAGSLRRRGQASEGGRAGRPHGAQEETVVGWIPLTSCVTPLTDRSIRPAPSSRAPRRRCRAMPR